MSERQLGQRATIVRGSEQLHVVSGPARGASAPIGQELLIGRAAERIGALGGDEKLSHRHARVYRGADGRLHIADLGSKNGTWVNGTRLGVPVLLAAGDRVGVGGSVFEIRGAPRDETATREAPSSPGRAGVLAEGELQTTGPLPEAAAPPPSQPPGIAPHSIDSAIVLRGARRFPIGAAGLTIGRDADNSIVLDTELASRHHARIDLDAQGYYLTDLGSRNGTVVGGERLRGESRWLTEGDTITVGGIPLRFVAGAPTRFIAVSGERLSFGRDDRNDVVLDDPNVSRVHAEVVATSGGYTLRDLGSRNGTRLNGVPVREASLTAGSEIGIGPFRLIFDGGSLVSRDDRGALRLDAEAVAVSVNGKAILQDTTLSIAPGEFVAIIGESGAGKTTLLKALAGVASPTRGSVTVNGEPVTSRLSEIGYVPQDEIVHPSLTVREALRYAAKLRLPADSSRSEVDRAVDRVVEELALDPHADTRIGSLSGGQRKRAGVGTELVNRPGLLFLDEATTGLDPVLERRMMCLMRDLADSGRAVITITHATKNLTLCDKVMVMGRGGLLCFYGSLDDALEFFSARDPDEMYAALDETDAVKWHSRWMELEHRLDDAPRTPPAPPATTMPSRRGTDRPVGAQAAILAGRYLRVMSRDRRNLLILLGQVPVLALCVSLLWPNTVFKHHHNPTPGAGTIVIFLLVTLSIWLGSVDAAREIIKERTVFLRESAIGVRVGAYLASKFIVLVGLASVQTIALGALVLALKPLDQPPIDYVALVGALVLTSWVAVAIGLVISVQASTENQATSLIPLVLVPQLLFAGQLVPFRELPGSARLLSNIIPSRWSFAGVGRIIDLNGRYSATHGTKTQGAHYGPHFFTLSYPAMVGILAAFCAVLLGTVALRLRRLRST